MFYVYYLNYFCKVGTIIIPILQMRELRDREVEQLAQSHAVHKTDLDLPGLRSQATIKQIRGETKQKSGF